MPQFMIEKAFAPGKTIAIEGGDAHHLLNVLRLKAGDWIILSDGMGHRYRAELVDIIGKSVTASIVSKLEDAGGGKIALAQAVIKNNGIEPIIKKAVELGVTRIIPFVSARAVPKLAKEAMEKKAGRWNKIALEAAKQCGLAVKPAVENIITFEEMIRASKDFTHRLIFFEGEEEATLKKYFKKTGGDGETLIVIGPEGGFAAGEIEHARKNGFATLRLGPLILRVETAAVVAIALTRFLQSEW